MFIYVNGRFLTQKVTGVQRFARELSIALANRNIDIVWLVPKSTKSKTVFPAELKIKFISFGRGYFWEQFSLPFFLKKNGSSLLLNLCNVAPLFYSNQIVVIHDLAFLENPKWFSWKFSTFYRIIIPLIARSAKKVLTVSEFSKREIVEKLGLNKGKVRVVYNGVSFRDSFSRYLVPDKYVLFVGSLDPRKNLVRLIEAVEFFPEGLKLVVIGAVNKNAFRGSYINFTTKTVDRVVFLGYVSDKKLNEYYKNAMAFVYPSLYEGFGLPPLEAQSLGVPVIVSDIAVFREVFQDSAEYLNPKSVRSIAESVNRVYSMTEKDRAEIIDRGLANLKRFSWENSAALVCEILKER